jgi:hypothetical protein
VYEHAGSVGMIPHLTGNRRFKYLRWTVKSYRPELGILNIVGLNAYLLYFFQFCDNN